MVLQGSENERGIHFYQEDELLSGSENKFQILFYINYFGIIKVLFSSISPISYTCAVSEMGHACVIASFKTNVIIYVLLYDIKHFFAFHKPI